MFDDLAEQFLVDCAYGYADDDGFEAEGCSGAWPQAYLHYLKHKSNGYHQMESYYPYTARDGYCNARTEGYYTGEFDNKHTQQILSNCRKILHISFFNLSSA